jgi:hypothetical protein
MVATYRQLPPHSFRPLGITHSLFLSLALHTRHTPPHTPPPSLAHTLSSLAHTTSQDSPSPLTTTHTTPPLSPRHMHTTQSFPPSLPLSLPSFLLSPSPPSRMFFVVLVLSLRCLFDEQATKVHHTVHHISLHTTHHTHTATQTNTHSKRSGLCIPPFHRIPQTYISELIRVIPQIKERCGEMRRERTQ